MLRRPGQILAALALLTACATTEPTTLDTSGPPRPEAVPLELAARLDGTIAMAAWEPPPTPTSTTAPPPPVTSRPKPLAPMSHPGPCGGWESLVAAYFPAAQVAKACAVMACETGGTFDPGIHNEQGSGASGLFQFLASTWTATTGLAPPAGAYSPEVQIAAAGNLYASSDWAPWSCA